MMDKPLSVQSKNTNKNFRDTVNLIKNYAVFTLDLAGQITSWNSGAELITGWEEQEVSGKTTLFLYADEKMQQRKSQQNLQAAQDKGIYAEETYLKKRNDSLFLAEITISPIHDEQSQQIGYITIARDITERKQVETKQLDANLLLQQEIERRKKIEADLKRSNEELEIFASAASHDLQEPLRMVVSYLQLIERRYEQIFDQDGKDFLHFAVDGANRMKRLISDLSEYSRIDTLGKPFAQTNATEALRRAIANLEVAIKENNAHITYDTLPIIRSDPVQLTTLFQNLLANAMKFHREEPVQIQIGVTEKAQEWIFHITDNGKGIEEKHLQNIFVIFKQLGKRAERTGSGLGLAISKKIVARHNGTIWVTSTFGKGSTFYFSIPKSAPKEKEHSYYE
jgi:PAS domain S-box-containing protein